MKKILTAILSVLLCHYAALANMTITGTVLSSEDGESLPGAHISHIDQSGNTIGGGITDENGNFNIDIDNTQGGQIRVSFVGYTPTDLPINANMGNISLQPSAQLDEVTVTAERPCNPNPGKGIKEQRNENGNCIPVACFEPCYKLQGNECVYQRPENSLVGMVINNKCALTCNYMSGYFQDGNQWKCTNDCTEYANKNMGGNVKSATYKKARVNNPTPVCEIQECTTNYYSPDGQKCILNERKCTAEELKSVPGAIEGTWVSASNRCVPTKCNTPQYKKIGSGNDTKCENQVGTDCTAKIKYASTATYEMRNGKLECIVYECDQEKGYKKTANNTCDNNCLDEAKKTEPLADRATYVFENLKLVCKITDCGKKDGKNYYPSDDQTTCEVSTRECNKETDKSIWPDEHTSKADYKKSGNNKTPKCIATLCDPGFSPQDGKCVSTDGSKCNKDEIPANATKTHRQLNTQTGVVECVIDSCKKGCEHNTDANTCDCPELSDEDAKARMDELKANQQAMHDKENSIVNKTLGAAGIGMVGIGGMQMMSGLAEQSADKNIEQEMRAYLETFRCDYGQGRNIRGGEAGIQIPTTPELSSMVAEYKQIASNLKISKESLDMAPGIESETIFDSATTGLYDDVSIGIQSGAFTSVSRALMDPTGADAQAWAELKADAKKKTNTGMALALSGAVASAAANLAINSGDKSKNKATEILNKYEGKKKIVKTIPIKGTDLPCDEISGTIGGGIVPNCQCDTTKRQYFERNAKQCVTCLDIERVNDDKNGCVCDEAQGFYNINGKCKRKPSGCDLEGFFDTTTCECSAGTTQNGNKCECTQPGYRVSDDKTRCEKCNLGSLARTDDSCRCVDNADIIDGQCKCLNGYHPTGNTCVEDEQDTPPENNEDDGNDHEIIRFTLSNDKTRFTSGNSNLADCDSLINEIKSNSTYQDNYKSWAAQSDKTVCVLIAGHTDFDGFGPHTTTAQDIQKNKDLSDARANAVKNCLTQKASTLFGSTTPNIKTTEPMFWTQCTASGYSMGERPPYNPESERRKRNIAECRKVDINIGFGVKSCDVLYKATNTATYKQMTDGASGDVASSSTNLLKIFNMG